MHRVYLRLFKKRREDAMAFLVLLLSCLGQTTVKDGSWHDPAIWSAPLTRDSDVVIRHKVTLTESIEIRTIEVAAEGALEVSGNSGQLEIVFTDTPIDTASDPEQLSHGLIIYGKLRVQGGYVEPYARVSSELIAGASFVPMAVPSSWGIGHRLYFPDTRQPADQFNPAGKPLFHEVRTIAKITSAGVTLDAPLTYHHLGSRDADGKLVLLPVIANLTRSIVFRSENPNGTRAHAIFTEKADVDIRGAAFLDMGRTTGGLIDDTKRDAKGNVLKVGTNPKGRYPVHFHHYMGPILPGKSLLPSNDLASVDTQVSNLPYQFVCRNNVVLSQEPLGRWGIVVHQAHYGLIDENVVVTCAGAGIVTEDGNETGNIFQRNYVAHVTGEGRPDARPNEIGFEGSAYWFRGGNNTVRDNHAYSSKDGYTYYARFAPTGFKYPSVPGGMADTPIDPVTVPIKSFLDNECASCQVGFSCWWIGVRNRTPIDGIGQSVIDGLRCWHVRSCVSNYESGNFRFADLLAIGDKKLSGDNSSGWGASDYLQWRVVIDGGRIENYNSGIRVPSICDRLDAAGTNPGLFVVRGTRLRNRNNVTIPIPWHNATAAGLPPITVHLADVGLHSLTGDTKHLRLGQRVSEFSHYSQWVNVWYHAPSWHLQFFGNNQQASAILPATAQGGRIQGASVAMPNTQAWLLEGLAAGGEIAPADSVRVPEVDGSLQFVPPGVPYIRPIPDVILQPGQAWRHGVCAYDPTLGELEYSIDGPAGMAIENRSGLLNWTAPAVEGKHTVTVRARDVDTGATGARSFTLTVRMPPG